MASARPAAAHPAAARRVARDRVLAFRLDGHHLSRRQPPDALLDVAAACGIRNTPPGSAALALHARIAALPLDAADRALAAKTLVEVLAMRLSPHLVPARDVAVFTLGALPADETSLRAPLANHLPALEQAGISTTDALAQAVEAARLELDGRTLTRAELSAALTKRLPAGLSVWCRPCNARHIQESLFRLIGVQGVYAIDRRARSDGYARLDQWLGSQPDGDRLAARAELIRRYLRCFGPSTPTHFASWAGIAAADAKQSWDALRDSLVEVQLEKGRAWLHAEDVAHFESPPEPTGVRLLPPYDAYLDQRDRETLVPDTAQQKHVWRILGNPGVVLARGEVVGVWRPKKQGKRLQLTVEPLAPLARAVRAEIEAEAATLAPRRGCATAEVAFAE